MSKKAVLSACIALLWTFSPGLLTAQEKPAVTVACFKKVRVIEFYPDGVQGFAVDLLENIAAEAGWTLEWKKLTFPASMELLEEGKADLVVPLGYTAERDDRFDFSEETLLTTWGRVFTKEKSDILSILDLRGKRVGYVRNSFFYPVMYNLVGQSDAGGLPRWVSIAGVLVLLGGILIGLWTVSLRWQVAVRTSEIEHLRNLLANIINSMPSALIGVDKESRVIQWNQQAEELTGINAASAQGRNLQELEKLDETIRTRAPFSHHKRIRRASNSVRYED
ncbi:MAG: transporter substrate-binding domain-containing protein, partial [Spirochaetota bacterium]|nr:transporter substrate-binding domain-containing protein [Spirochaetota bacterium]